MKSNNEKNLLSFELLGKWSNEQQNYGQQGEAVSIYSIEKAVNALEINTPNTSELEYELRTALTFLIENDIEPRGLGEIRKKVASINICFVYSRAIVYYHARLCFTSTEQV